MKALCSIAALSISLLLASCSSTRQVKESAATEPTASKPVEIKGNPFSTRARKIKPDDTVTEAAPPPAAPSQVPPAPEATPDSDPAPTAEQQAAAERFLAETASTPEPEPAPTQEPEAAGNAPLPPLSNSLRRGSIFPQEEAASANDAPLPGANSVELRGLRSPKLPSGLPMNIDGKLTGQH